MGKGSPVQEEPSAHAPASGRAGCRKASRVRIDIPQIGHGVVLFRIVQLPDDSQALQRRTAVGQRLFAMEYAVDEVVDFILRQLFAPALIPQNLLRAAGGRARIVN